MVDVSETAEIVKHLKQLKLIKFNRTFNSKFNALKQVFYKNKIETDTHI